jgi:predicted ATPase
VAPTEARRISFDDALRFEHVHAETYRAFGFDLVPIDAAPLEQRVEAIKRAL